MSIELNKKIEAFITGKRSEFCHRTESYRISLVLKDQTVACAIDINPTIAEDKALRAAVEYGLKKGWIKNESPYFTFSKALELLKQGSKVARKGWNGNGMWLSISCPESKSVPAESFWSPHNAEYARNNGGSATVAPCITLKNAQDQIVMGWIPSSGDLFADDWMIVK